MVSIIYVEPSGKSRVVNVEEGWSLMQGATANGVDGIVGECGGSCACGTCHCYIEESRFAELPAPSAGEADMLDTAAAELKPEQPPGVSDPGDGSAGRARGDAACDARVT